MVNLLIFILVFSRLSLEATSQCTVAQVCVTDLSQENCFMNQVVTPNADIFGCCPACRPRPPEEDIEEENTHCKPPSNCLPDGRYAPVQCKGDLFTGRCFCSDENGKRIFGQMWRNAAAEMSCACSRRRHEMEAATSGTNRSTVVSLHCRNNGDYEPLQCDNGMCWCVQPKTGQPTVAPVPEEDLRLLPCYSSALIGDQYLRQCESVVQATALLHKEQSEHGTNFLGNPITFCDYDGSYGPFQIKNGIAYCTDRVGEILGAWQTMASEMAGMNCNCARDTMMYFPANGMMVTEICQGNGNYRPNQNVGGVFYCVDRDGYPIELLDAWPADNCASYA